MASISPPFVRKTRVFLAEKGLEYKLEPVNPFTAGPEYKHISPLGKVPAFQDDQVTIADSSVICSYLERTNPTPALYPKDAVGNAKSLWFEEYGDSGLGPVLSGTVFRQKVVMPLLFKQPTDEEAVNKALNENIPPLFDYLESQLPASSAALVGGHFSVGDIGVQYRSVYLLLRPNEPGHVWGKGLQERITDGRQPMDPHFPVLAHALSQHRHQPTAIKQRAPGERQ